MLELTPDAVTHLRQLLQQKAAKTSTEEQAPPQEHPLGLRLSIEKGGCAGLNYQLKITTPQEGDTHLTQSELPVYIAPDSADYLRGCRIDYIDDLNDAGFKIENPNANRSCGCGTSFEPKDHTPS